MPCRILSLRLADTFDSLARVYVRLGQFDNAERYGLKRVEILERQTGPDQRRVADALVSLAYVYGAAQRLEQAQRAFARALELGERAWDAHKFAWRLELYAEFLKEAGWPHREEIEEAEARSARIEAAIKMCEDRGETRARCGEIVPRDPPQTAQAMSSLPLASRPIRPHAEPTREDNTVAWRGLSVRELTPNLAKQFRVTADTRGLLAVNIDPGSLAAKAGLEPGDGIKEVNRMRVGTLGELERCFRGEWQRPRAYPPRLWTDPGRLRGASRRFWLRLLPYRRNDTRYNECRHR